MFSIPVRACDFNEKFKKVLFFDFFKSVKNCTMEVVGKKEGTSKVNTKIYQFKDYKNQKNNVSVHQWERILLIISGILIYSVAAFLIYLFFRAETLKIFAYVMASGCLVFLLHHAYKLILIFKRNRVEYHLEYVMHLPIATATVSGMVGIGLFISTATSLSKWMYGVPLLALAVIFGYLTYTLVARMDIKYNED